MLPGSIASGASGQNGGALRSGEMCPRNRGTAEILETDLWVQYNELGGIQVARWRLQERRRPPSNS